MNRSERRRNEKKSTSGSSKLSARPLRASMPAPSVEIQQLIAAGKQHHSSGNLSKALEVYKHILAIDPKQPTALYLAGIALHQAGQHAKAIECLQGSLSIFPDNPEAYNNLGVVFNTTGNTAAAEECYRRAIALKPEYAAAYKNLGALLASADKLDAGLECYRKTVSIAPNHAESLKAIGEILIKQQKYDQALESFLKARAISPTDADILTSTGIALQYLSRHQEALKLHSQAVNFQPDNDRHWDAFRDCVAGMSFSSTSDGLEQSLLALLDKQDMSPASLMFPIISALRHRGEFSRLLDNADKAIVEDFPIQDDIKSLSQITLFMRLMTKVPVADLRIERLLTNLRRALLSRACCGEHNDQQINFISVLAQQCFINEYAYAVDAKEQEHLKNLKQKVEGLFAQGKTASKDLWLLIACYEPLNSMPWKSQIPQTKDNDEGAAVYRLQIIEPETEKTLRKSIPQIADIEDATSQNVRAQYEENPYPRWIHTSHLIPKPVKDVLCEPPLSFKLDDYTAPENPETLVAGCGTGQHAIQAASRFVNTKVTAVDLSLGSLSYALRKTREAGIKNLEYIQGDILKLDKIGKQFDMIECGGVLHHMADPLAGWKVLVDLLRDGGLMKIGLYSEKGRPDIIAARKFIEQGGYGSSAAEMRRCRQDIVAAAEKGDPQLIQLCMRGDFYSLSPCRDLIFHVQEHRFTIPEIASALDKLGLEFLGFETPTPQTLIQFRKENPNCPESLQLDRWCRFEERFPDTFRGMYQFWCRKPAR
ncbi:class I SAM-dependent methyltransferase [Thalassospira lucentensis]|uniref:class I SAM-dependent methyltransferase n=1 Tax=Thalassospira lucentensis TaxID=168935 RepID=UPI00138B060F|nr:class I SAM-dependent methyltransferase [Thalassospira lucentensis]